MKLNIKALAMAFGLIWAAGILFVEVAHMIWPGYGAAFLQLIGSIYPGYRPGTGVGSVIVGTLYGLVDGGVGGACFAWLYNLCLPRTAN
jgi:hypothetical protein